MGSSFNSGENPAPVIQSTTFRLSRPQQPHAKTPPRNSAYQMGVSDGSILIMLIEDKTWSDGCLGLGGPAESCLAALAQGFRIELVVDGKTFVYRAAKTGASARRGAMNERKNPVFAISGLHADVSFCPPSAVQSLS